KSWKFKASSDDEMSPDKAIRICLYAGGKLCADRNSRISAYSVRHAAGPIVDDILLRKLMAHRAGMWANVQSLKAAVSPELTLMALADPRQSPQSSGDRTSLKPLQ